MTIVAQQLYRIKRKFMDVCERTSINQNDQIRSSLMSEPSVTVLMGKLSEM